jgi:hypothetical protein
MGFGALGACGNATISVAKTVSPLLGVGDRPLGPTFKRHSRIVR